MTLKEWIKISLGYPTVNVELTDDQLSLAIDFALQNYLMYADLSHYEKLKVIPVEAGQSLVPINNSPLKTNEVYVDPDFVSYIVYAPSGIALFEDFQDWEKRLIMKSIFGDASYGLQGIGRFISTLGWIEDIILILGQNPTWQIMDKDKVRLMPTPQTGFNLGVVYYDIGDYSVFEDNIIFKELALGKAMVILGEVYSKYGSIPSANGDITLKDLITRGEQKIADAINNLKLNYMIPPLFVD